MHARGAAEKDQGESLIELVLSVAIMGIAVVAIASSMTLTENVSDIHRKQATASADVRDFAEAVNKLALTTYTPCATNATYAGAYTAPGTYTASITSVLVWNPTASPPAWAPSGVGCTDRGVQQVTLQVQSNDTRAIERLVVLVRKCADGGSCP
jgi:Tfp pilus assembly protein PilV